MVNFFQEDNKQSTRFARNKNLSKMLGRFTNYNHRNAMHQRWLWIQSAGVDLSRILRFSFGPGVKNLWKTVTGSGVTFQFRQYDRSLCGHFSNKHMGKFPFGSMMAARVWIGVGFSNLKNFRTQTRIQKFWNRSGVGFWKSDSGHRGNAPLGII